MKIIYLTTMLVVGVFGASLIIMVGNFWGNQFREHFIEVCPVRLDSETVVLEYPSKDSDCGTTDRFFQ